MRHVTSPIGSAPVADPGEGSGGVAPLKIFLGTGPPFYLRGWMTGTTPPPLI